MKTRTSRRVLEGLLDTGLRLPWLTKGAVREARTTDDVIRFLHQLAGSGHKRFTIRAS